MLSFVYLQYLHKDIYVGSYSLTTPHLDTHTNTHTHTNTDIDKTMQQGERNVIMAKNEKNETHIQKTCTKYIHDMQ